MKQLTFMFALLFSVLLFNGCEQAPNLAPQEDLETTASFVTQENAEQAALALLQQSGWPLDAAGQAALAKSYPGFIKNYQREQVSGNVYHYSYEVVVGEGDYDVVGLHRVVREDRPNRPIQTEKAVFLLHGDAKRFATMFMPGAFSPSMANDFGIAPYLAANDVDVWGIDQGWTLVPAEETDLSFMANWGLQRQIDDLRTAMAVARFARARSGNGHHQMILSGYSSGVATGFAALNEETQLPPGQRHISGFIPVDLAVKMNDPAMQNSFYVEALSFKEMLDNGYYHLDIPFIPIGNLARNDPDGDSPILPGLTNLQAALFFGAGQIFGAGVPTHYLAGVLDGGFPVDLQLMSIEQWLDFLEAANPYEALLFLYEMEMMISDVEASPFDDYFGEIEVPILNVAAAGGFGAYTYYGISLMGSSDVTHLIPSIGAPSLEEEFGHIDIFTAYNAETLVWEPVLNWISAHSD